jgi:Tol biopolymer transport system component
LRRPGVIVGIAVAILAVTLWRLTQPAPSYDLRLTEITFDPGFAGWPAISADGRMVAYASDRAGGGNLDLYVQPVPGGSPVRVTQTDDDESEPAFSPDGATLAYRSTRDGGGIYLTPVAGGGSHLPSAVSESRPPAPGGGSHFPDAVGDSHLPTAVSESRPPVAGRGSHSPDAVGDSHLPTADSESRPPVAGRDSRLLAPGGHMPRYSPDGHWIAFCDSTGAHVVASSGGAARPFHPEFPALRTPAWSPDGRRLLFWAAADLWVAPLEGGRPESTGVLSQIAKAGLGPGPFDDGIWTSAGFLFSARTGFVRNLYRCPLDSHGKAASDILRLTNGTELIGDAAASREGRIVFAAGRQRFDIWALPLDAGSGKAAGAPYRIAGSLAPTANPDLSSDGRMLLFGSSRNGFTEVWQKDLATGKESVAATSAEGATYGRWLKNSGRIVYVRPAPGHNDVYLDGRKLAAGARPWDVDSKQETLLLTGQGIDALDLKTGQRAPLIQAPEHTTLSRASFSPDDRWIVFLAETGPRTARIYVAPARGGPWLPVAGGADGVDKPRFSPDGRFLYFTLDHDGARGIQAVRFDPQNGRPLGQPFAVFEPRHPQLSLLNVNPQAQELAVARDKLAMILCESLFTIWIGEPVPLR